MVPTRPRVSGAQAGGAWWGAVWPTAGVGGGAPTARGETAVREGATVPASGWRRLRPSPRDAHAAPVGCAGRSPPALRLGVAKGPPRLLSAVRRAGARSLVSCALAAGTGRDRARSAGSVDRVSGRCMLSAETLVKQRSVGHRWIITSTLATKRSLRGPVSSFPGFQSVTGFELSCGQLGVGGCVAERTLVPSRSRLTGGQALPLMDVLLNGDACARPTTPAGARPTTPAGTRPGV